MKRFGFEVFFVILIQGFVGESKTSGEITEGDQSVNEVTLNRPLNETVLSNDYMYLHKPNGRSENYLNYRAIYGLRYKPTKKPTLKPTIFDKTSNYNFIPIKYGSERNGTVSSEVISAYEEAIKNANDVYEASPSSIESETTFHSETSVKASESSQFLPRQNYTFSEVEPTVDESRKHIMRPNNRVEESLEFLAERLKKLLYHSADKTRPESKLSPHLSSLGRFLSLFAFVKLENVPCLTAQRPLRQLSGTCYNEVDCLKLGGIAVDRCASGFGVCCVFKGGCSSVTHQNATYFESPYFPLPSRSNLGTCSMTVLLARNVKQVLVEFMFFELLPPTQGDCLDDQFYVTGQNANNEIPIICGIATGQHMFLEVDGSDKIQLIVQTRTIDDRAFSIRVTQLRDNLSPQGCFQYYTNSDGLIKSFNYDDNSQIQLKRSPTYFNNLNYSVCIKRSPGCCKITYTNELNGREDVFDLVNVDDDGNIIPDAGQAAAEVFGCESDFIAVNFVRLCGSKLNDGSSSVNFNLNSPVQSYMNGPIVIPFKTNNNTVGRGFQIYYFQDKCVP